MPEQIWFSADSHYRHRKIIDLCQRPFPSLEEMEAQMIERWNKSVGRNDRAYFLGDFSFGDRAYTERIIRSLNGQIHVIRGNHDKVLDSLKGMFASFSEYKEIRVSEHKLVLFHYPIASWHGAHQGAWHLHGHSHGSISSEGLPRMDVGVDPNGFRPISFEEVEAVLSERKWEAIDHHAA